MKDHCPVCGARVVELPCIENTWVHCTKCAWVTNRVLWDDADNDPDKSRQERYMAEAEATNPNN